jgi:outer membrane murein-binding lipoprotein Lpp
MRNKMVQKLGVPALIPHISTCALTIFTLMMGCVATPDQLKGMNERQTQLEAKVKQLSQDIEELKSGVKSIEHDNAKLKDRLDKLEKNEGFSGFSSAKSPNAQYRIAESYYGEGKFEAAVLAFQSLLTPIRRIAGCRYPT